MKIFEAKNLGNLELKNGIFRSATFEGMADKNGFITDEYIEFYKKLSEQEIGGIITGFTYISQEGKAMQKGQAGIDNKNKIVYLKKLTDVVNENNGKIFLQIAHTGRQTRKKCTGKRAKAPSYSRSPYFREWAKKLDLDEIRNIINQFGDSAFYAKEAGFHGIQLHCAHGYLIHQFLHPSINRRKDAYGITNDGGTLFLKKIIENIRKKCGQDYPILVKVSGSDDINKDKSGECFINLIKFLDTQKIDAIEISYGTMDYALNIFRGDTIPVDTILKFNPIYSLKNKVLRKLWEILILPIMKSKLKKFTPMYNLEYAKVAKAYTNIPIISVGGFRNLEEINYAHEKCEIDFVSLCRPFLREADFVTKLKEDNSYKSKCINCNVCAIMTDSEKSTGCIFNNK